MSGEDRRSHRIMQYINHYNSPIGGITLAGDGKALTGL